MRLGPTLSLVLAAAAMHVGWDASGVGSARPAGLRLVDTRTWTERQIHPHAQLLYVRGGRLLTVAAGAPSCPGPALAAYTFAGEEPCRVCEPGAAGDVTFSGRYARLGRIDARIAVVELADGTVVGRFRDVRVAALQDG